MEKGRMKAASNETRTHTWRFVSRMFIIGLHLLDKQTDKCVFKSHWVLNSYGLVPHLSEKPSQLLNVHWRKQQAGNIHVCKNEMNNSYKIYKFLSGTIHFEIFAFSLFGLTKKRKSFIHICFNQRGDISTLNGSSLKLVGKFNYLGCSVSSTENHISTQLVKAWTAIDRLSVIWKSDLSDEIESSFFPSTGCVSTAVCRHHMDADQAYREKNLTVIAQGC